MKKIKLLIFSASPFLIGYLLNYMMMNFNWFGNILSVISILFFICWYYLGYKSYDYVQNRGQSMLIGNAFGMISIILILFQELVIDRYFFNLIGTSSQMYFLPTIRIGVWIESIFFFISFTRLYTTFIFSLMTMMIVYYAGYTNRSKKKI